MVNRRWIGINLFLLLLYGWTLTETVTVSLRVRGNECQAELSGRIIAIPCDGLAGGSVGFMQDEEEEPFDGLAGPFTWLATRPGWTRVQVEDGAGNLLWQENFGGAGVSTVWQVKQGAWQSWLDELRPASTRAFLSRPVATEGDYLVAARLRRADETSGVVLLRPDGHTGYAFILTPGVNGSGLWWEWEDGAGTRPLIGIPFDKPLLAQFQVWLRSLLAAHQGALLLLLAITLLTPFLARKEKPQIAQIFTDKKYAPRTTRYAPRILLLLLTFFLTTFIARNILEGIPHVQDSLTYLFQAQTLARGRVTAPAPALPQFFEQEFMLVQDGQWFGKYSPGFPALLAVGVLLDTPWLINPLLATLTIALFMALGKLFDTRPRFDLGWLAAALCLSSPFFLFLSGSTMAHAAELFWTTLLMWSWGIVLWRRQRAYALLAGVAFGMLFLTRAYAAATFAFPFILLSSFTIHHSQFTIPNFLSHLARPLLTFSLTFLPFLATLYLYQYAVTGSPWQDPRLLFWAYDRPGFGPTLGLASNVLQIELVEDLPIISRGYDPSLPPRGHTLARGLHNLNNNWSALNQHLFGWLPFMTFSFVWLLFLRRPTRRDGIWLAAAFCLILAHVAYWHSGIMYGPRYLYIALPAFILLTVRGVDAAARFPSRFPQARQKAILFILLLLILGNIVLYLPAQFKLHQGYNFISRAGLDLVATQAIRPALVFITGDNSLWWEYGQFFSGNTPWLDGEIIYARDLGDAANRQLIELYPERHIYRFVEGELIKIR